MMKCKWAGDPADEYCKSCDGVCMMVEGIEKSCTECNGYEEGTEEVAVVEEQVDEVVEEEPVMNTPVETKKPTKKPIKKENVTNSTPKEEKPVKTQNTKPKNVEKVAEEKYSEEDKEFTSNGIIQVTCLRYTSSATVKKGDNYYKFTAEEEWSTSMYTGDIQDVREQLWAKLNGEVDKQIEELNNM